VNEHIKRLGPAHFLVNDKPIYIPASPRELGLNARTWRQGQAEAIAWLASHQSMAQVVEAPTGWGKSLLLLASGLLALEDHGGNAFILTATKNLQEKELGEYPDLNVLKGMNAYDCLVEPFLNVEQARCHGGFKCPQRAQCDYYAAREQTKYAPLTSMNYHYYLASRMYSTNLPAPTALLCDEVHNLERVLMGAISVTINEGNCKAAGIPVPPKTMPKALKWAQKHIRTVDDILTSLKLAKEKAVEQDSELSRTDRAKLRTINALSQAMSNLLATQHDPSNWVLERADSKGLEIKPIFVHDYARRILWKGAGRVILTSATLPKHDEFARMVGLPSWTSLTLPSLFPVENRPVIYDPISESLNYKTEGPGTPAWNAMVAKIDEIIDHWPTKKGFIHSVSYARASYIYENSRHRTKLIQPVKGDLSEVLEYWTSNKQPRWLISPSVWEGIDQGADEHAAVQIIVKIPYLNRSSPQIKARIKEDPAWEPFQTGLFMVQATGRGMRHPEDECTTYLIDGGLDYWLSKYSDFLPDHWKSSLITRKGPKYPKLYSAAVAA